MRTRRHLEFLASAFGLLLATARGALATNVGGTITADTTWNLAGSPYVVTSTVYVEKLNAGSVTPILTIDPGVTVSFNGGTSLIIGYNFAGELHAGAVSPAAAATFTANGSTTPGFWAGIKFWTNATSASYIKNASIKYGGVTNATGGIHVNGSSPTLQALTVQNNAGSGISISGGSPSISSSTISSNPVGIVTWAPATPSLQTLTLSGNTGFAISQDCNQTLGTVSALTMTGNGTNAVELRGGTVAANTTWKKAGSPYVITNQVYVEGTPTPVLTIEAGTTVKVAPNTALYIGYNTPGDLQAIGTSSLPIVFTASSGTTAGSWRAVSFNSHTVSTAKMVYVTVSYGGYPAYSMGGIQIVGCSPTLQNVTVSNNLYAGISISGGSPSITGSTATGNPWGIAVLSGSPSISTTTVSSNTTGGISLGAPGTPSLQTLTITNNTGFAISQDCNQMLGTVSALTMTGNGTNAVELRGGTVAANTTWKKAGSPYVITNQVYVEGTPTPVLTIEAGTTVKVVPNTALYVGYNGPGDLQAIGTSSLPIVFTASSGTTAGSWRAVSFNSHTVSTAKMVYVTVSYGGYPAYSMGGIQIVGCSPTLQNVTVSNNLYAGISISGGSPSITGSTATGNPWGIAVLSGSPSISTTTVSSNTTGGISLGAPGTPSLQTLTITNNTGFAISQDCSQTLGTVSALTMTGNGTNAVELRGGTVAANTTWKKAGSPYVITNQVYVEGTPTPVLTIEAGTTVKVAPNTALYIGYNTPGDLQAIGTSSLPIVFTASSGTTAGSWRAVSFNSHTVSTAKLVYVTVSYGGYAAYSMGGIQIVACSPTLQNVTVSNNAYAGITVAGAASPSISASTISGNPVGILTWTPATPSFQTLTLSGNAGFAISQDCNQTLGTVSALTSTGNGTNAIELRGGTVAANTTWKKGGSPYVMTNQVYVEGTPTPVLTIEAGTTVKVVPSTSLYIGYNIPGDLQAIGTASQPIVFTANTTTPTPGYWRAVSFNSHTASTAKLVYATVSYGGYGAYSMGGVQVVGCSPILQNLTLSNNTYAGISVSGGSPAIINSSFAGNTAGLINLTAGTPITANLNYWGSATGPSGAGSGTGQSVSTGVKYEPWLLAAPSSPNYFSSATQTNRTFNPAIAVYTKLVAGTTQTGTWTTTIANSGGTIVRTFTGSGLTETVIWDGKNGSGVDQPDGTYTYQLDATAAGGVATSAKGYAIIDRTKQLLVSNLTVSLPFFSPNGDTVQDTTTASGSNAFDDTTFTINIKKPGGTIVRTNVTSGLSFSFTWDGKNGSGVIQADALYTFEVTATNGTASATSTITTTLDNTLPTGSIAAPLNGAVLSNVYTNGVTDVAVTGSTADANFNNWVSDYGAGSNPSTFTGLNSGNSPVTNASFGTWATAPLANGLYTLRLRAWDKAGNVRTVTVQTTVGNFSVSENALQLSAPASNTVTYTSIVPFTLTETLTVKNAGGTVVRTLVNAVARPAATYNDVWNGKNASSAFLPDGPYFYVATVTDGTHNFTWDLTNQYLNDWATEQNLTMPNWDPFNNQPLVFTYNFAQPSRVTIAMKHGDGGGCTPPSYCIAQDKYEESGAHTIAWAGVDGTGALRSDVNWNENFSSRALFSKNAIVLYGTKPAVTTVTVTPAMYGPAVGTQTVAFDLATFQNQAVPVTVTFRNQASLSVLRTISLTGQSPGHKTVVWDGHADNGMWVAPGFYTVTVSTTDSLGNQVQGQILTTILY